MISATVKAGDSGTTYLGKKTSELQKDVKINAYRISGVLNNIKSYPEFSSLPEEQSGHYLVLTLDAKDGATIRTKIGKSGKEVTVADGYCVYRVKDASQQIYVTTEKAGDSKTKVFDLSGLQLM